MKICTIVGARPQFIKAAVLSRELRKENDELLIHTGQHYDYSMSEAFFDELSIPKPEYNLGVSGLGHGAMTGRMLEAIEAVLIKESPDMAVVFGDTNSTLAGALAAVKLHIPVCHVEAGCRMMTLVNPEEVNRVLVDRISTLLMCPTWHDVENLHGEGIREGVYCTGDIMYDALLYYGKNLSPPDDDCLVDFTGDKIPIPPKYYLLTCHREENTGSDEPLFEVLTSMNSLDAPTVYIVHPRNKDRALRLKALHKLNHILLAQPVGYLTSLRMIRYAEKVVTDSGGLQREAYAFDRPCVLLLEKPIWPELLKNKLMQLCKPISKDILKCLAEPLDFTDKTMPFGDGSAGKKMVEIINEYR